MRIATNRNYENRSIEYIDVTDNGILMWSGEDEFLNASFSFPVDIDFTKDFFSRIGRTLDVEKLPKNFVSNPYRVNR